MFKDIPGLFLHKIEICHCIQSEGISIARLSPLSEHNYPQFMEIIKITIGL